MEDAHYDGIKRLFSSLKIALGQSLPVMPTGSPKGANGLATAGLRQLYPLAGGYGIRKGKIKEILI